MVGIYKQESGRYAARVDREGETTHVGTFDTENEAYAAREQYIKTKKLLHKRILHGKITFICDLDGCNNSTTVYRTDYDTSIKHYCGRKCYGLSRIGKPVACIRVVDKTKMITFVCDNPKCDETKTVYKSQLSKSGRRFCSKGCARGGGRNTTITTKHNREDASEKYGKIFSKYFKEKL